jgi:hypothetical protein
VICASASSEPPSKSSCGAAQARIGESLALLGWNISVADSRWNGDFLLVEVDAAPAVVPEFARPIEVTRHGLGDP